MSHHFDFETLDVYQLAVRVARWARSVKWPEEAGKLRDECIRAADSVVLNTAEGRMRGGRSGRNHYRIALGSAGEACAVLDLVDCRRAPSTSSSCAASAPCSPACGEPPPAPGPRAWARSVLT